jgi:hypothetical protein
VLAGRKLFFPPLLMTLCPHGNVFTACKWFFDKKSIFRGFFPFIFHQIESLLVTDVSTLQRSYSKSEIGDVDDTFVNVRGSEMAFHTL